jgi:hypothetical protein
LSDGAIYSSDDGGNEIDKKMTWIAGGESVSGESHTQPYLVYIVRPNGVFPILPMHRELRDPNDARNFVVQGLLLQQFLPASAATVRLILEWAFEIAAEGQPLPPIGFLADLGHAGLGKEYRQRAAGERLVIPGLAPGLVRAYEDHVLGKVIADATFERAADALRRYQGRDQARGLAFIVEQMRERVGWIGVHLSPAVLKALLRDAPEQVLAAGTKSLGGGVEPLLASLYEALIAAMRRCAELLGPEDLFELEHGTALQELGQRVALRQVLRGVALLEALLPLHRPRPRVGRQEVPTRMLDADTYPVGGFSSLTTRGTIESLLHSQLAYMEQKDRPDLFDLKYLRDELLYYARDENHFLRRRRTFFFALWPDLVDARVKDADLPFQRGILLLAWVVALVRRLEDWLRTDALSFVVVFVDDREPQALAPEQALLEVVLGDLIQNGTAEVQRMTTLQQLRLACGERARSSMCHCLTVSTQDRVLNVKEVESICLRIAGPSPELVGIETTTPENTAGIDSWASTLQVLLDAWL